MMHRTLLLCSAFLLSSCALATPVDTGKANMVMLAPVPQSEITCARHVKGNIIVAYPLIGEDLDTYRIAILDKGRRDYLAHMRWADFLPGVIQSAFAQSLSNAGSFGNAFTDDEVLTARWKLLTEVRRFEVVYDANEQPSRAVIEMRFELRSGTGMAVKKQFVLLQSTNIRANNANAIVQAFREAFGNLQKTLIEKLAGCQGADL